MINAEKFSTELEKLINNKAKIAIVRGVPCNCNDIIINCKECQRNCNNDNDDVSLVKWLTSEYVIKLNKQEKLFLSSIKYPTGKSIRRDFDCICLKYQNIYNNRNDTILVLDESLFSFIKVNEEWSVDELLRLDTWED